MSSRSKSKYPNLNPGLAADTTRVLYDVRKAPSGDIKAARLGPAPGLSSSLSSIRVISHAFPWTLNISAPVTCAAVFEELHQMLQKSLTDSEWGIICLVDRGRCETIKTAANARAERDKDKKLKRIDWLGETTAFMGLEKDKEFEKKRLLPGEAACPETWVVKFGRR